MYIVVSSENTAGSLVSSLDWSVNNLDLTGCIWGYLVNSLGYSDCSLGSGGCTVDWSVNKQGMWVNSLD